MSGAGVSILKQGWHKLGLQVGLVALTLVASSVSAVTFQASLETTRWQLDASRFLCRLTQPIPDFGQAVFEHGAGEEVRFELRAPRASMLGDNTRLTSEPPLWWAGRAPRRIGVIQNQPGDNRVRIRPLMARAMLASLSSGYLPTFTNARWMGTTEEVRVAISAANFATAYADYVDCVSSLLPVNFRQIARSALLFPSAEWRLSDATKKRLENVALYVKNDSTVTGVFVDGHSDRVGRRLTNRDLSRKRAEAVSDYLARLGVQSEMITTRYHGERYPVIEARTSKARARNRRVTVRLEREEDLITAAGPSS